MFELSVKNGASEVLDLTSSKDYTIYKITGLNPPKVSVNSSSNVGDDGSTINSVRLEKRNLVIYIALNGNIENSRIKLYKYFPIKKNVTIYFNNNNRKVFIDGTVEAIECDLFSKRQIAQISILCSKPYFKSVDYLITTFGDIESLFEFPFSISDDGIEFSTLASNQRKSIINSGDVASGVVITLFATGTVVNPVLYNVVTQEHMAFNYTMLASDEITINTNVGEKSITLSRNGVTSNALGYMTPDSKWFVLEAGDNLFTYDADSGTSNLQITFTSSILYGGV